MACPDRPLPQQDELMRAMKERVKEVTCLYAITESMRTGESPEAVCRDVVRLIPPGWQYPDITVAQIQLEDQTFESDGFKETDWMQEANIISRGRKRGILRVGYLNPKPEEDHGVFLKEETALLNQIAGLMGDYLTRTELAEQTRKTQERFKNLFELGLVGLALTSTEKGILMINDRLCDFWGYSREELLAMDWVTITHPDDLNGDLEQFNRILAGEIDQYNLDKRYIRKDGEIVHAHLSVHAVRKQDGTIDYIFSMVEDITDRIHAMEQLKESEQRFRALYQNVPISLWDEDWATIIDRVRSLELPTDTNYHAWFESHPDVVQECLQNVIIKDVNTETLVMFGADSKAQILQSLETVFNTPDTLPGFIGELAALAAGKTVYETEMLLNKVDGSRITVLLKMTFPPPGATHGQVLVSLTDISELKQIQHEIEHERAISESVVDALPGVFYQIRPDATFARWNTRFETVTGYSSEELKRMKATQLFRGEDVGRIAEAMQRVFVDGEAIVEADFVGKDGTAAPYLFNGKLFEIEGEPYLIGMGLDVSDMKQVEADLRKTNRELERFNQMAVGREKRMIELKQIINHLRQRLGEEPPYDLSFADDGAEGPRI